MAIYKSPSGYVISDGGGWLPGVYDCEETAELALKLPYETLEAMRARICDIAGEDRAITAADLSSGT